jgi:hypothetical protein
LRFQRVAVPTNFLYRADRSAEPPAQHVHYRRVAPSAAAYQPFLRRRWEMSSRRRDSGGSHLCQRGGTVVERKAIGYNFAEIVAIERFWRRALEEAGCQKQCDVRRRCASGAGECPIDIRRGTNVPPHPIIDQRVTGPGVEGKHFRFLADPRDIGDPADIKDRERLWQRRGKGGVEQRSKRRSLPSRRDVGRTEIGDDVEPKNIRQQRPVAQLPGAAFGWAMQDGVTVQADDVDMRFGMTRDKLLDRVGVKASQLAFDFRN